MAPEPDERTAQLFARVYGAINPDYPDRVEHALGVVSVLVSDQQRRLLGSWLPSRMGESNRRRRT